ncbi:MAG TPA: prolipoprotein diacylglyceryl transferase, partial [Ktedonobacteraceae bacterium]
MSMILLAYVIDLGWFRIGPPYIYLNINPVLFSIGPFAVHWYGLMYVVAIIVGLWAIRGYLARKGIDPDTLYRILWWCIAAGLIGARLYFVIQQPDLVQHYILQPWRILATWEGGMAFYGAIFLIILTLYWRARVERLNPLVLLDAGVLFAVVGQIFGRFGNIINGDIIGYPSTLPWSTVYQNPNSWACLNPATCNVPVQPAAVYEILTNIVLIIILFSLARRVQRPGILSLVYLFGYAITQFLVFFVRVNDIVSFLGWNPGLKQAQWTSIVVFILLIPASFLVMRWHYARPIPEGEVAATYGVPQKPKVDAEKDAAAQQDEPLNDATSAVEDEEETPHDDVVANENEQKDARAEETLSDEAIAPVENHKNGQKD